MRTTLTTLSVFAASAAAYSVNADLEGRFVKWASEHGRQYATIAEFGARLQNWIKTDRAIERINAKPDETVVLGHNKFSDWTDAEYKSLLTYVPSLSLKEAEPTILDATAIPDSIDWVAKGAVNAVQDQGQCGSCWAFSAVAAMEGAHFVKSGELLKLSEQQCVDCDTESYGCGGGW